MFEVIGFFILIGSGLFMIVAGGFLFPVKMGIGGKKPSGRLVFILIGLSMVGLSIYMSPLQIAWGQ